MRTRRATANPDSLDLLLDTITNAFGGIVLLALLIALLAGSPDSAPSPSQVERDRMEAMDRLRVRSEIARVEESLASLRLQLGLFDDEATNQLWQRLLAAGDRNSQLMARERDAAVAVAEKQKMRQQLVVDTEMARRQASEAAQRLQQLTADLEQEKRSRQRSMPAPRERATSRRMAAVFVKGGELFLLDRNRGRGRFECNADQFAPCPPPVADVVLSEPQGGWQVRPGTGVPLSDPDAVRQAIRSFPTQSVYLAVVIWPDSFDHFGNLRAACVDAAMEHKLIPIQQGPVYEGSSPSGASAQ